MFMRTGNSTILCPVLHIWQRRSLAKTVSRAGCSISKSLIILYLQVQINAIKFILGSALGQGEKSKVRLLDSVGTYYSSILMVKVQLPRLSVLGIPLNLP